MKSDLEELLREGIDRATAGERLGPGLTARARQRLDRRRLAICAAAAAGTAAAIAAAGFLTTAVAGQSRAPTAAPAITPPGSGTGGGVRLDAVTVLDRAARAALGGPSPQDNQFIYTDVRSVSPTHGKAWSSRQQTWESADGSQPGALRNTTCFPGLPDRDNLPTCLIKIRASRGGPLNPTYAWTRSLPSRPAALLRYLEHHNNCSGLASMGLRTTPQSDAFSEIFTILESLYVLPPRPGASLFLAAAMIPGVTVLQQVTDAAGGRGIAVAKSGLLAGPGETVRFELIFDPHTYRFIGSQIVALRRGPYQDPGRAMGAERVVSSRVVDRAPADYTKIGSTLMVEGGVPSCILPPQSTK